MKITVDKEELEQLTEVLWRANQQLFEIRNLTKEMVRANNDLIWQLYGLVGLYDWPKNPNEKE